MYSRSRLATQWTAAAGAAARAVENRPAAVAQRERAALSNSPRAITHQASLNALFSSPRLIAQRRRLEALFGDALKNRSDRADGADGPVQRRLRVTAGESGGIEAVTA